MSLLFKYCKYSFRVIFTFYISLLSSVVFADITNPVPSCSGSTIYYRSCSSNLVSEQYTCEVIKGGVIVFATTRMQCDPNKRNAWCFPVNKCTCPANRMIIQGSSCVCPEGSVLDPVTNACEYPYALIGVPEVQSPQACVGNPIDVSTGSKIQVDTHIYHSSLGLEFAYRFDGSTGIWMHVFAKKLGSLTEDNLLARSATYPTAADACVSGWSDIKSSFSNPNVSGGLSQFSDGRCKVISAGKVVKELPVQSGLLKAIGNDPDYVLVTDHLGNSVTYRGLGLQNTYQDMNGSKNVLIRELTRWKLNYSDGKVEHYDVNGRLIKIIESGIEQQLSYDPDNGNLLQVVDNKGHKLTFAYSDSKISSVTLDNTKTTTYAYTANGMIERVTHPDNTFRIYHYEDTRFPTALTGITDERNVRYATWAYDAQGRAISSEHAGGAEKTLLSFNADGSTTVTNSLGKQTIYRFDYINGAKRVVKVEGQASTNCLAANKDYTYTPEGWLESKTDWKGIKTTYVYNTLGQEISRTEAFGTPEARTIVTEWHPTLYLKTKITEPEREVTFVYDDNGRLLNQKTRSLIAQ